MATSMPHESFKGSLEHLWTHNRPLAYALIGIGLVGAYILYKHSQNAVVVSAPASTSPTSTTPSGTSSTLTNIYRTVTKTINVSKNPTVPAPMPGHSIARMATIRNKNVMGPDSTYDKTHTGVPVQIDPTGYHPTGKTIAYGTQVQLIGPILDGGLNRPGGSNQWYPISGGYLSAWDIASVK